jgi:hypothetical protein
VQLGARNLTECKLGLLNKGEVVLALEKKNLKRRSRVKLVHHYYLSLNMTCGVEPCVPSPPNLHHFFPSFLSLKMGPTESEIPSLLAGANYSAADPILDIIQSEKWKRGQTVVKNYK